MHLQLLVIADPPGRFEILRVNRGPITYAAKSENRTSALTLRTPSYSWIHNDQATCYGAQSLFYRLIWLGGEDDEAQREAFR